VVTDHWVLFTGHYPDMLRTKLFQAFALLILVFAVVSAALGVHLIQSRVVREAEERVRLDLSSAWAGFNARLHEIETVVQLVALKKTVMEAAAEARWDSPEMRERLEQIRQMYTLDFLTFVGPDGAVALRAANPEARGDFRGDDALVAGALQGRAAAGLAVWPGAELDRECPGLARRAQLKLEDTPHARASGRASESRGLAMVSAAPVMAGERIAGAVYGGILLNRNEDLVDRIQSVVFGAQRYGDGPPGTATIFLDDARIATTVRRERGERATGTRVSAEVAERVLDRGEAWVGRAFVVRDWYLTAYEPLRDLAGRTVGILYVGILERPFREMARGMLLRYLVLSLFGLAAALGMAFFLAQRLARPIHRLVEASDSLKEGRPPERVDVRSPCREIETLVGSFNAMAHTLAEREARLKESNEQLEKVNLTLRRLNQNYMDMVGFVSHELKGPVAAIMNYVYLLEQAAPPLAEPPMLAVKKIETGCARLLEMIRRYLNLSRIETGELAPDYAPVPVLAQVLAPLLEAYSNEISARRVKVENGIGADVVARGDVNMICEVFENLISNALKYGADGGTIRLTCVPASGGLLEFAVRNQGAGIPAEKLAQVFEKYARVDGPDAIPRQDRTGLGLYITRKIIAAHGGTICVESHPGEWTEFRFTLPAAG